MTWKKWTGEDLAPGKGVDCHLSMVWAFLRMALSHLSDGPGHGSASVESSVLAFSIITGRIKELGHDF